MGKPMSGIKFLQALCKVLELPDGQYVHRITIEADVNKMAEVCVYRYLTDKQADGTTHLLSYRDGYERREVIGTNG